MGAECFLNRRSPRAIASPTTPRLPFGTFRRFPPTDRAPEFARPSGAAPLGRWRQLRTGFEELPESVTQINFVEFNRVCSVLATTEGFFEVDIQEMPNMVKAKGLPRQIVHPQLHEAFTMARYVEDPLVLGIHPAMAIVAKTKHDRVCVC